MSKNTVPYFDFIDHVECIGVAGICEIHLHESIGNTVAIACSTTKGIVKVCLRMRNSSIAS